MSATRRKLPIGIQTFSKIREDDYYYVDKTPMAWALAQESGYYFLSRPRRFGKSLFLDTLAELFEGNEEPFRGLFIHGRWNWQVHHPVIRISFSDGVLQSRAELDRRILDMTVRCNGHIYLFEFKVVEIAPAGRAMQQLKDKAYADKYRAEELPIHLIGVEFSREERNVMGFEIEAG